MNQLIETALDLTRKGDEFISLHGPLEFHKKAHELLEKADLHKLYNFSELVEASFSSEFNGKQNYGSFQFSDLPVTLAMGERCFVDLYFWRRRPTVIHDHHFTGAFQCLEGINVDLEFEFIKSKTLGRFHDLGEVRQLKTRKILKGDIAPIDLLDRFIHQNHHQAELTINACFRTPEIGETNLSNYLYSGLRYEKDPELLGRIDRLLSFINIGAFDLKRLDLNLDDAINFLIRSYRSKSQSKKFHEVRDHLNQMVETSLGLDLDTLMDEHENKMDELENHYN